MPLGIKIQISRRYDTCSFQPYKIEINRLALIKLVDRSTIELAFQFLNKFYGIDSNYKINLKGSLFIIRLH